MAEVTRLKRVFVVEKAGKKIEIPDPNPELSETEVHKLLMATYPELTNASIEGPAIKNEVLTYSFKGSFAPKG